MWKSSWTVSARERLRGLLDSTKTTRCPLMPYARGAGFTRAFTSPPEVLTQVNIYAKFIILPFKCVEVKHKYIEMFSFSRIYLFRGRSTSFYTKLYILLAVKFYIENWISASVAQTRNPFSHTAYVKMTCVKY